MSLILAYLAGLLTLLNPCVLPVLPIVLATALGTGRTGPLYLAAGMTVSFTALGVLVSAAGPALGLTPDTVTHAAALAMVAFGAVMMVPQLSARFATAAGPLAARADAGIPAGRGAPSQLLAGLLLGAVWSPCIGPTLGGAIALASAGRDLPWATAVMLAFSLGVSTLVLAIGYGLRGALLRHREGLQSFAGLTRPVLGAVFILVGLALFFDLHHLAEGWALTHLPPWLTDLSVRY